MTEQDLAWLAGYLEGEGCFTTGSRRGVYSGSPKISVTATDEDVVARAAALMGCVPRPVKAREGHKAAFRAEVHGDRAIALMQALLPLVGRRRQAAIEAAIKRAKARPGQARGERCGSAKLTDEQVASIYREYWDAPGRGKQSEMARRCGVTQSAIWYIVQGHHHATLTKR